MPCCGALASWFHGIAFFVIAPRKEGSCRQRYHPGLRLWAIEAPFGGDLAPSETRTDLTPSPSPTRRGVVRWRGGRGGRVAATDRAAWLAGSMLRWRGCEILDAAHSLDGGRGTFAVGDLGGWERLVSEYRSWFTVAVVQLCLRRVRNAV